MSTIYKTYEYTIGRLAVNLQYSSRYFHPNRTQPFIVTLFMAVMALKVKFNFKIYILMHNRMFAKK